MRMKKKHKEKYLLDVSGRVVIVTGGAGQLGGRYVRAFLESGAFVAIFDQWLENPKGGLKKIKSNRLMGLRVDITDKRSIEEGLGEVISRFGYPKVLVNNAALDTPPNASEFNTGPFETYPEEAWDQMMNVNLKGSFLCCQIIGSAMAKNGGGSIINISSIYGMLSPDQTIYQYKRKPFFKAVGYSVSKSGIYNLTRYLATYWAKKNVRVNTLTLAGVFNNQEEIFLKNYSAKVPLGRMARPDEYNGPILFLASEASSYMTGANLICDGGYSAW